MVDLSTHNLAADKRINATLNGIRYVNKLNLIQNLTILEHVFSKKKNEAEKAYWS
jgi:hypothetical protein